MDIITLAAQPREVGKKATRAARREGDVPCVLYGHHVDPVVFQIPEKSLKPLVYTSEMHLVRLELNDSAWDCIVKEIAFHPVTDRPLHADFQVLQSGEKVTLSVPIRYLGTSLGQSQGGRVTTTLHELEISCLPKDIPSFIDVDITNIGIGDTIVLGDIEEEGIEFHAPTDQILMTVTRPRAVEELEAEGDDAEDVDGEEAEDEEGSGEDDA